MSNNTQAVQNLVADAVDPNETSWQEVRELGIEPEPAGMQADEPDEQN